MTSIKTVATQAQVSIATVSRVLNKSRNVNPEMHKRFIERSRSCKFCPGRIDVEYVLRIVNRRSPLLASGKFTTTGSRCR